jgi:single-strand DNA-binding protein
MNDTFVTFRGWVGGDVRHRVARDVSVATFRVGATPRLKKDGEWVDGETTWYSVTAWRQLADNLAYSIRKGDPVIVHGRLRSETWTPEEGPASTTLHVEALLVGHDLTRGITHFSKARRDAAATTGTEEDGRQGASTEVEVDEAVMAEDAGVAEYAA